MIQLANYYKNSVNAFDKFIIYTVREYACTILLLLLCSMCVFLQPHLFEILPLVKDLVPSIWIMSSAVDMNNFISTVATHCQPLLS